MTTLSCWIVMKNNTMEEKKTQTCPWTVLWERGNPCRCPDCLKVEGVKT